MNNKIRGNIKGPVVQARIINGGVNTRRPAPGLLLVALCIFLGALLVLVGIRVGSDRALTGASPTPGGMSRVPTNNTSYPPDVGDQSNVNDCGIEEHQRTELESNQAACHADNANRTSTRYAEHASYAESDGTRTTTTHDNCARHQRTWQHSLVGSSLALLIGHAARQA